MAVPDPDSPLGRMRDAFPRAGRVTWIGLRTARREHVRVVDEVEAVAGEGLRGDHWTPRPGGPGTRQVTLLQAEHLPVIAALTGHDEVDPAALRRNLVVEGINLTAVRGRHLRVGGALLALAGPCDPCSRMEEALGEGAWNALRGHGGWNAQVVEGGTVRVGDPASAVVDL